MRTLIRRSFNEQLIEIVAVTCRVLSSIEEVPNTIRVTPVRVYWDNAGFSADVWITHIGWKIYCRVCGTFSVHSSVIEKQIKIHYQHSAR